MLPLLALNLDTYVCRILYSSVLYSRACVSIAKDYQALSRELFNAAFLSCWLDLMALITNPSVQLQASQTVQQSAETAGVEQFQSMQPASVKTTIVQSIEFALRAPEASGEVAQTLLNLIEFLEHYADPIDLSIRPEILCIHCFSSCCCYTLHLVT